MARITNVSHTPVHVDRSGTQLDVGATADLDPHDPAVAAGIARGVLVVLPEPKTPKEKA